MIMRKKDKKIKELEKNNKLLVTVIAILSFLVLIGIGMLAVKTVVKKTMHQYEDIDYLVVDKDGTLTGFTEYNLTKEKKVEYKDGVRTKETYSAGDKLTTLIEKEEKTEVVLPKTIKKVDKEVFYGNTFIKSLKIEMNIKEITDSMFYSSSIEKITLPDSVKTISTNAFNGCMNLQEVVTTKNSKLDTIKPGAFSGCSSLKSINLKNIKEIGSKAFYGCNSLKKVYLSVKLEKVGSEAFKYLANNSQIILQNIKTKSLVDGKYTLSKTSVKLDSKAFK